MKNLKLCSIVALFVITAMIVSSCGIIKNNDFSSQKYTSFKKGKTTANIAQTANETIEETLVATLSDKTKNANIAVAADEMTYQPDATLNPEIKTESAKKASSFNDIIKETKKEKLSRSVSFVKERLIKKSNTVSQNNDALRVILIIAFVLLILWAVGLWGFGLGSLIYVLLVIALALLILWLVQMV